MCDHLTPAAQKSELAGIITAAAHAIEALDLYEDVFADEVSEEISRLLGLIGVRGHVLRRAHINAHKHNAAFFEEVFAGLDELPVTAGADKHEDWDDFVEDWNSTTEEEQ